jgi:3-dehydroquinate synthetase
LHGEAVGIGVAFAARLAQRLGRISLDEVRQHDQILDQLHVPRTLPPGLSAQTLIDAMSRDKKAHHNLTFVLGTGQGFEVVPDVSVDAVRQTLIDFGSEP